MDIAVVSTMSSVGWGGSEELWASMSLAAVGRGHRVGATVLTRATPNPKLDKLYGLGVESLGQPAIRGAGRLGFWRYVERTLPRRLAGFEPDVVLLNFATVHQLAHTRWQQRLADAVFGLEVPVVILVQQANDQLHPNPTVRRASRRNYERAAGVCFVSRSNWRTAERQLACLLPNAEVVRNPIAMSASSVVPWPPEGEPVRMLVPGRLQINHKGQDLLLDVLRDLVWAERRWRLALAGSGPDREYLEGLAQAFGLEDRVEFLGQVGKMRDQWAQSHLLVLSSRQEGLPLSLIEGMTSGRPVVVTTAGGSGEVVEEGVHGFLAAHGSRESLAAAMERAWAARERWQSMGQAGHEAVAAWREEDPGAVLLNRLEVIGAGRRDG